MRIIRRRDIGRYHSALLRYGSAKALLFGIFPVVVVVVVSYMLDRFPPTIKKGDFSGRKFGRFFVGGDLNGVDGIDRKRL